MTTTPNTYKYTIAAKRRDLFEMALKGRHTAVITGTDPVAARQEAAAEFGVPVSWCAIVMTDLVPTEAQAAEMAARDAELDATLKAIFAKRNN